MVHSFHSTSVVPPVASFSVFALLDLSFLPSARFLRDLLFTHVTRKLKLFLQTRSSIVFAAAAVVTIDVTASATSGTFALSGAAYPDGLRLDNIASTSVRLSSVTVSGAGLRLSTIAAASAIVIQDSTVETTTSTAAVDFAGSVQTRRLQLLRTRMTQRGGVGGDTSALRFSSGVAGIIVAGGSAVSEFGIRHCTIETSSAASSGIAAGLTVHGGVKQLAAFVFSNNIVTTSAPAGSAIAFRIRDFLLESTAVKLEGNTFTATGLNRAVGLQLPVIESTGQVLISGNVIEAQALGPKSAQPPQSHPPKARSTPWSTHTCHRSTESEGRRCCCWIPSSLLVV